jgi:hypothetical protein
MNARTMSITGHEDVVAQLTVDGDLPEAQRIETAVVNLQVSGERVAQLGDALQRALNTTMDAPSWLLDLCDMCDAARGRPVPRPFVRPEVTTA